MFNNGEPKKLTERVNEKIGEVVGKVSKKVDKVTDKVTEVTEKPLGVVNDLTSAFNKTVEDLNKPENIRFKTEVQNTAKTIIDNIPDKHKKTIGKVFEFGNNLKDGFENLTNLGTSVFSETPVAKGEINQDTKKLMEGGATSIALEEGSGQVAKPKDEMPEKSGQFDQFKSQKVFISETMNNVQSVLGIKSGGRKGNNFRKVFSQMNFTNYLSNAKNYLPIAAILIFQFFVNFLQQKDYCERSEIFITITILALVIGSAVVFLTEFVTPLVFYYFDSRRFLRVVGEKLKFMQKNVIKKLCGTHLLYISTILLKFVVILFFFVSSTFVLSNGMPYTCSPYFRDHIYTLYMFNFIFYGCFIAYLLVLTLFQFISTIVKSEENNFSEIIHLKKKNYNTLTRIFLFLMKKEFYGFKSKTDKGELNDWDIKEQIKSLNFEEFINVSEMDLMNRIEEGNLSKKMVISLFNFLYFETGEEKQFHYMYNALIKHKDYLFNIDRDDRGLLSSLPFYDHRGKIPNTEFNGKLIYDILLLFSKNHTKNEKTRIIFEFGKDDDNPKFKMFTFFSLYPNWKEVIHYYKVKLNKHSKPLSSSIEVKSAKEIKNFVVSEKGIRPGNQIIELIEIDENKKNDIMDSQVPKEVKSNV